MKCNMALVRTTAKNFYKYYSHDVLLANASLVKNYPKIIKFFTPYSLEKTSWLTKRLKFTDF